jgi:anti-sigma-K factor RskA
VDTETHELIAAYALDALDGDERARAKEVLATSEEAREELRSLTEVTAAMATAAVGPAPRPELRDRILEAARAEPQNVVPLDERRRRSRLAPALGIVAAVAACAALGLGIWGASVASERDDARSALARERATAAVLAHPAAESSLTGASGRLVVGPDGHAVLVVSDVPPVPEGKTYQVWVIDGGNPVSGGLFSPDGGTLAVPVDGRVRDGSVVAVTVEDGGGASAPTAKPVIASAPVTLS